MAQMFQHEISVVIKGRANENLDQYRALPRLAYGLPLTNPADRGFVFLVFKRYQEKLGATAQFDTDDIALTAIGQLDTPIWRRRRTTEGFDAIFVDETHLFNMNELSVFHFLTKRDGPYSIAYSVDRSQALGDRGWGGGTIAGAYAVAAPACRCEGEIGVPTHSLANVVLSHHSGAHPSVITARQARNSACPIVWSDPTDAVFL